LWDCTPEMLIETQEHQHYLDEWNGVLNLASEFTHQVSADPGPGAEARTGSTTRN